MRFYDKVWIENKEWKEGKERDGMRGRMKQERKIVPLSKACLYKAQWRLTRNIFCFANEVPVKFWCQSARRAGGFFSDACDRKLESLSFTQSSDCLSFVSQTYLTLLIVEREDIVAYRRLMIVFFPTLTPNFVVKNKNAVNVFLVAHNFFRKKILLASNRIFYLESILTYQTNRWPRII